VFRPGDDGYHAGRARFNLTVDEQAVADHLEEADGGSGLGSAAGPNSKTATMSETRPWNVEHLVGQPGHPVTLCYRGPADAVDRVVHRESGTSCAPGSILGTCAAICAGSSPGAAGRASRNAWVIGSIPIGGSKARPQFIAAERGLLHF